MIRLAKVEDISKILEIVKDAKDFLRNQGVDQWQGDYPTKDVFINDINKGNLYVYEEGIVKGFAAIIKGVDITYNKIYDGSWLSDGTYLTIHRIAVKKEARKEGIASKMIEHACKLAKAEGANSIRIDTHEDNIPMQNMIEKNGFKKCGIIYLLDGNKRLAYEKIVK